MTTHEYVVSPSSVAVHPRALGHLSDPLGPTEFALWRQKRRTGIVGTGSKFARMDRVRFRDRYRRRHHGHGAVTLDVVIPLLTLTVPVIALVSGIRRGRPNHEGITVSEFGWGTLPAPLISG